MKEVMRDWQGAATGPHESRVGDAASLGFVLCGKCGLPFTAKGLGAHARSCSGTRPPRPLNSVASGSCVDGGGQGVRRVEASPVRTSEDRGGSRPEEGNSSPGFRPPLIAAGGRINMLSPTVNPGSSTPGSAAAQALQALMLYSGGREKKWLLDEISLFNVPVRRRCFPKEASRLPKEALDETLSLALSLHNSSFLALSTFSPVVLFPRFLLRPLPNGCQGSFAAATLARRCNLLREGKLSVLLT
jgi:hypothetical protein